MQEENPIQIKDDGILVSLYIQPKSSKNQVVGIHNGAFKLKIKAPPVDGAANKECIKFISKEIKIPKSSITIISGHTGRQKKVLIKNKKDQTLNNLHQLICEKFK